jgi:hypothetical protein
VGGTASGRGKQGWLAMTRTLAGPERADCGRGLVDEVQALSGAQSAIRMAIFLEGCTLAL